MAGKRDNETENGKKNWLLFWAVVSTVLVCLGLLLIIGLAIYLDWSEWNTKLRDLVLIFGPIIRAPLFLWRTQLADKNAQAAKKGQRPTLTASLRSVTKMQCN